MRLHCFCETLAQAASCKIHDTDTLALERTHGGQGSYLAQPPIRACREGEPRWIGTVHNIKSLMSWEHQDAFGEPRMRPQTVEELGPVGGRTGIGPITRN